MAGTSASGSSPYCSVEQFLRRYDRRSVAELLSDDLTPVALGDLEDRETLADLLAEASGLIESAACLGQRYLIDESRNDLAALTDNSAAFLAGMVAHLTMHVLWNRRPALMAPGSEPPLARKAEEFLERLRLGERVFGILESHQAAQLDADRETNAEVERRNGPVIIAQRFFGTRVNRELPG